MRDALSRALVAAARRDPRVVVLTGDHGYALFDEFRAQCGDQYINAGVAETNMVGVAAGLAKGGFHPIVYGLSAFVPVRVYEQIKLDVCYESLPVCFLGDGAGFVYSTLGASHQCTEDLAALRALPEITLLSPADAVEMTRCMELATQFHGPTYLRIGKADLGDVGGSTNAGFDVGDLRSIRPSDGSIAWLATGSMAHTALEAAGRWPGSGVWTVPCIKPLDRNQVVEICRSHRLVVTLEEHSVHGGLGAAIAEIATEEAPSLILKIGVQDRFSLRCGSYAFLQKYHQLDLESVWQTVNHFCARHDQTRSLSLTPNARAA